MKICIASYHSMMTLRGGPRTQITQTKAELEKLGVKVSFFDSWKEFHAGDFDLVHIFTANFGTYQLARALKMNGIPTVVTPVFYTRHSNAFVRSVVVADRILKRGIRGLWTDYGLISEMCGWARMVLPTTHDEARLFSAGLGIEDEKMMVVPVGVERRFSTAKPSLFKKRFKVEDFILNVGHIGPERKNVYRLIQALETVAIPAVIIGKIEQSPRGKSCLERARKNPRLTLIDGLPHDSPLLASAYAACDVFALPSLFETPGIAALEAGIAGAKIVITGKGGTRDYFGTDAEYVDPSSVDGIREGIVRAAARGKTKTLQSRLKHEFTWSRVAVKTKEAYEKALG